MPRPGQPLVFATLSFLLLCNGCTHSAPPAKATDLSRSEKAGYRLLKEQKKGMGTLFQIQVWSQNPEQDLPLLKEALARMDETEQTMSEWLSDSEVSQLNHRAGKQPLAVSQELYEVLKIGREISQISRGAFAMTWAALRGLWNFNQHIIPTKEEIEPRLALIGDEDIEMRQWEFTPGSPKVRLKRPGMQLGLGGIAKGYALDQAMQILVDGGIRNALIFAGGDILTRSEPGFRPWKIAIEDPRSETPLGVLHIPEGAVATSGDYEKFFIKDGKRYHHLLDPRTGFPAPHHSSVTVVTDAGVKADAWATALFIMEPKDAIDVVEYYNDLEAIIVNAKGEIFISDGLEDLFVR
ncbi:MAG: hypothetical protein CMH60_07095 [Myxococcales bacterium]|nr:hypothetical protein [Myxococcales bacterium]|tara:strand:- start:336 stop:1391 length:1056 start_codon:yes stop_codon:yes gene_type:complete